METKPMTTFTEFQATSRDVPDIAVCIGMDLGDKPVPGRLYLNDTLYIERVTDKWPERTRVLGQWYLLIGREDWFADDIAELERILYAFAVSEGYVN
jgi:hypothetical protein